MAKRKQLREMKKSERALETMAASARPKDVKSMNEYVTKCLKVPKKYKFSDEYKLSEVCEKVNHNNVLALVARFPSSIQGDRHANIKKQYLWTTGESYYSVPLPGNDKGLGCATACVDAVINSIDDLGDNNPLTQMLKESNGSKEKRSEIVSKSKHVFPDGTSSKVTKFAYTTFACIHDGFKNCLLELDSSLGGNKVILHSATSPSKFLKDAVKAIKEDHCSNYHLNESEIVVYPLMK